jgi:serine/threonine protein kinase
VKLIRPELAQQQELRDQFLAEAVVTGDLDHPNVIPVHDVGVAPDGTLFYAMKEVRGTAWNKVIAKKTEEENLEILLKVADAVAYAHSKGVVHRDLKPENVMLGDFGEVLVMDWGLAIGVSSASKAERLPSQSGAAGTPAYLSPEMALGEGERIGPASDIYLLGGMLYEIVTGLRPHAGKGAMACLLAAARNEIQPTEKKGELVRLALKAMATQPADRYPDVKAFQQALRDYRRHAESIALATQAKAHLAQMQQGQAGDAYRECNEAISGYRQALALWAGNVPARGSPTTG